MSPPLLSLRNISLTFGSTPLLTQADMAVHSGERLCVVGRNGSGKSTLLKICAGLVEQDGGERFVKPGTSWRYLPQEPDLTKYKTIEDYVRSGLTGADPDHLIPYLLDALKLNASSGTQNLSGGEARRAALARVMAPSPDILFLDEPTNHLDLPAIEWLEGELMSCAGALVLISHDRRFLSALSRQTIWVDRGETKTVPVGFDRFESWRDEYLEQEALDQHKLKRKIHREQHWVVHGVSGRRKRNVRRLKELGALRQRVKDHRQVEGNVNFDVIDADKSGKTVAKINQVSHAFDDKIVISDFSMRIGRGERIGIVGPNGAGKTTLLKIIMGQLEPNQGSVNLGVGLEPLIIDQKREKLDPNWTLQEALTDDRSDQVIVGDKSVHVQSYMKDFLFLPEQARTPIHVLSGGERGRLQLARGLRLPSNLLVLDEPTNDLDLETLDLLQELIAEYKGTVILVSHDRDFIDRTVTRTIAWQGPGNWQVFAGGYSDMLAQSSKMSSDGVSDSKKAQKSKNTEETAAAEKSKNRLSYKHKFRLEKLPGEMESMSQRISAIEARLADPDLFQSDLDTFAKLAAELDAANASLEALETEWLELEMLREEAE